MAKQRKKKRSIAIELCKSDLHFAVRRGSNLPIELHSVKWRDETTQSGATVGREELTAALRTAVEHLQIAGAEVSVLLDGDYCVTRIVTGGNSEIRASLDEVAERSKRYLSLGHGPKTYAEKLYSIDARNQRALLSVVNHRNLDSIVESFYEAGLQPRLVQPSLVSLCRSVGAMDLDTESAVLVVKLTEGGVQVGISHGGSLLLEYRPGGLNESGQIAKLLMQHRNRLQRYCDRYLGLRNEQLTRVLLCGPNTKIAAEHGHLAEISELEVMVLDPTRVREQWELDTHEEQACSSFVPVLGNLLLEENPELLAGPNLLESLVARERDPWWKIGARVCWPIAAVLLLTLGVHALGARETHRREGYQQQMDTLGLDRRRIRKLLVDVREQRAMIQQYETVRAGIPHEDWADVLKQIATCLRDDSSITSLRIVDGGQVEIHGITASEEGLFEFREWLQRNPEFRHVALHSSSPLTTGGGHLTQFHMNCEFTGSVDREEHSNEF